MPGTGKFCVALTRGDDPDREEFVGAGGQIIVNGSCIRRRRLNDDQLVKGASVGDPATLVEFLSDGTPCVSY
jgi:hypothetical protein